MGYFIALFLLLIIASLATAGFFMLRRKNEGGDGAQKKSTQNKGMVHALTFRISLSVTLFICVLIAWQMGWIQPTGLPLKR